MLILGIESSCDDTSVALVDCSDQGHFVVAQKTASQIDVHAKYGGVVPEIAGRMHAEKIVPLIEEILASPRLGRASLATGRAMPTARGAGSPIPPSRGAHGGCEVSAWPIDAQRSHTQLTSLEGGMIQPDAIAVTAGPGLITGLLVGVEAAKVLSYVKNIPLVAVNHIDGHVHSVEIKQQTTDYGLRTTKKNMAGVAVVSSPITTVVFPALAIVVSGGHTELILMRDHGDYTMLGKTKDDAAGECFDKVAKLLGFPYPGGPQISKFGAEGNVKAVDFPRPMLEQDNFDFSFAGLKTAALYWLRDNNWTTDYGLRTTETKAPGVAVVRSPITSVVQLEDFCASFEQAIVDVLVAKTIRAAKQYTVKTVILAGGVSANQKLRETLKTTLAAQIPYSLFLTPSQQFCMDNGAMIAVAGYYLAKQKKFADWRTIQVDPNWRVA